MDKIMLRGYVKGDSCTSLAEIILTLDELKAQLKGDLSQIKKGSKVWLEGIVDRLPDETTVVIKLTFKGQPIYDLFDQSNIVAHFPSEPEKKETELPKELDIFGNYPQCSLLEAINKIINVVKDMKDTQEKLTKKVLGIDMQLMGFVVKKYEGEQ